MLHGHLLFLAQILDTIEPAMIFFNALDGWQG
ncbi:hypothetical protein EMIT0373P_10715 [Pseudomonas chlororaphis]